LVPRVTDMRATPILMASVFVTIACMCHDTRGADDVRAKLSFFQGSWTLRGSESTYTEVCEWLPGGGFLSCRAEERQPSGNGFSQSIFGYSAADGMYTYNGFDGIGTSRALRGTNQKGIWRFFGQSDRGPTWQRWQVTITPTADGFRFKEEVSERGGPWKERFVTDYVRVK
ncbi:MAG: hypothetical protein ABI580_10985, partial [Burkholderiaceae bacterium]